jgi:hypothetical protein
LRRLHLALFLQHIQVSWAMRSSQVSTNTCSILDWLAWVQQGLVQANSLSTSEHVQMGVRGCRNFTDERTTSWAISSEAYESTSFSCEHSSYLWVACKVICSLVSFASWASSTSLASSSIFVLYEKYLISWSYLLANDSYLQAREASSDLRSSSSLVGDLESSIFWLFSPLAYFFFLLLFLATRQALHRRKLRLLCWGRLDCP